MGAGEGMGGWGSHAGWRSVLVIIETTATARSKKVKLLMLIECLLCSKCYNVSIHLILPILLLTWNKQTALYFSSKDRFIWDQQRITIWGLQQWRPHANSHPTREGESFYKEEKEVGSSIVNKESMAFYWLSPCQERRGVFLPVGLCYRHRAWEFPFLILQLYLIEASVY